MGLERLYKDTLKIHNMDLGFGAEAHLIQASEVLKFKSLRLKPPTPLEHS